MTEDRLEWIVCRGANGEVMGAVSVPDMSAEAVERRAQERRKGLEARYPGSAIGKETAGSNGRAVMVFATHPLHRG